LAVFPTIDESAPTNLSIARIEYIDVRPPIRCGDDSNVSRRGTAIPSKRIGVVMSHPCIYNYKNAIKLKPKKLTKGLEN
jgi:hypothetical protein